MLPYEEEGDIDRITAKGLKLLCFRLSMITNTSIEYLANLPYADLVDFVDELSRMKEAREEVQKE